MKHLFLAALAASLCPATMMAQEATYYNFSDLKVLDLDDEESPVMGSITAVSRNGQYAVGSDWELTYHSWLWTASGTCVATSVAPALDLILDVNDAGTTVGSFFDAKTQSVWPGYRTSDGTWHRLPQPSYALTANQNWAKSQYNDAALPYVPTAYYISNDGRHIGGWTYAAGGSEDERPGFDAKLHGFFWHMNDAGEYELEDFTDMNLSETQQGFRPYAMNDEGTIMAGLVQREDNGLFEPAAIIDGELRVVIEAAGGDFSEAAEKGTDEGSCFAVSGRYIYGYADFSKYNEDDILDEGTVERYSFRYNADTRQLDKLYDVYVKVANSAGQCLAIRPEDGKLLLVESDFSTMRELESPIEVSDIYSASDDFKVIGGIYQQFTDYGLVNTPVLIQYLESPVVVGVEGHEVSALQPRVTYDLQGRRADRTHGIVIEDGVKTIK